MFEILSNHYITQCNHLRYWKQLFLAGDKRGSQRDSKFKRHLTWHCFRAAPGKAWEGMRSVSSSKDWPPDWKAGRNLFAFFLSTLSLRLLPIWFPSLRADVYLVHSVSIYWPSNICQALDTLDIRWSLSIIFWGIKWSELCGTLVSYCLYMKYITRKAGQLYGKWPVI